MYELWHDVSVVCLQDAFERKLKAEGTPLSKFAEQYRKKRTEEAQREIVERDQRLLKSEDLPEVERPDWKREARKATAQERAEFKDLFASGSSAESESEEESERPTKRRRKDGDESDLRFEAIMSCCCAMLITLVLLQ